MCISKYKSITNTNRISLKGLCSRFIMVLSNSARSPSSIVKIAVTLYGVKLWNAYFGKCWRVTADLTVKSKPMIKNLKLKKSWILFLFCIARMSGYKSYYLNTFCNDNKTCIWNLKHSTIIKKLIQIWNDLWLKVLKLKLLQNILNQKL